MWQKECYYCGIDIPNIGIDRVDNAIGYVIGNVQPCCTVCNMMKRSMSEEMFIEHCKRVAVFR